MNQYGGRMTPGKIIVRMAALVLPVLLAAACALVDVPDGGTPNVPTATPPHNRYEGLNEKRDPITRVKLGRDILMPQPAKQDVMPDVTVGPYELRGETLASALQLILDDYDISLAFESNEGLTRRITVSNMHGKLGDVVNRVCSLADLYCHLEDGALTVKNTETFVVDLPPLSSSSTSSSESGSSSGSSSSSSSSSSNSSDSSGGSSSAYDQIATGLQAIIGSAPTIDETTRVMIYSATQRSQKYAQQYFERLRKNTALIIFETNIWEVSLNNENRTGINWELMLSRIGNLDIGITVPGTSGATAPVSISPTYTGSGNFSTGMVLEFLSTRGTVKTISQPQITVLSGSRASFAVSRNQNFVSGLTRTPPVPPAVTETVSTTTGTVTTGLNMEVTSAWDQSTVYGNLNITLDDLLRLDTFTTSGGNIQLPQTTQRSLQTAIRVRPGDAILIGGLVSEKDNYSDSGPGFMKPLFPTSREATKSNTELVFLLRPRIVVFTTGDDDDTPSVVNAPHEGVAKKVQPPPEDISDIVEDIFAQKKADEAASPPVAPVVAPPAAVPIPVVPLPESKKPSAPASPAPAKIILPPAKPDVKLPEKAEPKKSSSSQDYKGVNP